MKSVAVRSAEIECRTPEGRIIAVVEIVAPVTASGTDDCPLLVCSSDEARQYGEEPIQLRERRRYEYCLRPAPGSPRNLGLLEQRGVQPSQIKNEFEDRGLIETRDHCGRLGLIVIHRGDPARRPLAYAHVEVRSVKLGYREDYRAMLSFIADQCAGLILDCRAATRLRLSTIWQQDSRMLEQQLEFLRYTVDSPQFQAAVEEVLCNPHRRLEQEQEDRDISRPFKHGSKLARQIAVSARRVAVPSTHPLCATIKSLPSRITARSQVDNVDTAENRFVKMALRQFRDFLAEIVAHLARPNPGNEKPESQALREEAERLGGMLETQLLHAFFHDVSTPTALPIGSPVLQCKAGYRELLRYWLQFHASSQLVWDGGPDIFDAGARNVATLYEYWLFFQLEALFRRRFACDRPLHAILVNKEKIPPQLVLKRGVQLKTPVSGVWSKVAGRNLRAEFNFNRKFAPRANRLMAGSWTRGVQPDYTISIWPAEYSDSEAEKNELMVHLHFDAKYRVEHVSELVGDIADDADFGSETANPGDRRGAANYSDLLKMHAYRDAIRRTAGAYVIYPGGPGDGQQFSGYHEVLPGLGAFAVRPCIDGKATGIEAIETFLDDVLDHLANRTTARKRMSYHVVESYRQLDMPVHYDSVLLPEADIYGDTYRALPPAEDMVLLAWYRDEIQLELARQELGFVYVRLGRRQGALHVHPNLAKTRHVLMHTNNGRFACGLLSLREPGFRVFTRSQLQTELRRLAGSKSAAALTASAGSDDLENIYALFQTQASPSFADQEWQSDLMLDLVEKFESDARNRLVVNVGRTSAYPRILPLRDVLKARF